MLLQLWGLYRVAGPPQPAWFPYADKLEHAAGFALPVMLILLAAALRVRRAGSGPNPQRRRWWLASSPRTVVSEAIQHVWYRNRTGDPLDVLADWVGIAAVWCCFG